MLSKKLFVPALDKIVENSKGKSELYQKLTINMISGSLEKQNIS